MKKETSDLGINDHYLEFWIIDNEQKKYRPVEDLELTRFFLQGANTLKADEILPHWQIQKSLIRAKREQEESCHHDDQVELHLQ